MMRNIARRLVRRISLALYDRPLPPPTPREKEAIEEFRRTIESVRQAQQPGEANDPWREYMDSLIDLALNDDVRSFTRWAPVRASMFVDDSVYIPTEFLHLKQSASWSRRWSRAIIEDRVGRPNSYPLHRRSSGNRIHHAYHLAVFEEKTGMAIDKLDVILEFGGGYGSMCRIAHKLGFRGRYIIFDLPPFSALQRYYLTTLGIDVAKDAAAGRAGVACVSEAAQLASLVPREDDSTPSAGLFVATWSFSESPLEIREKITPFLDRFNHFLIAFQSEFAGVDNVRYFDEFRKKMPHVEWQGWPIEHIPRSYYLVGKRRG